MDTRFYVCCSRLLKIVTKEEITPAWVISSFASCDKGRNRSCRSDFFLCHNVSKCRLLQDCCMGKGFTCFHSDLIWYSVCSYNFFCIICVIWCYYIVLYVACYDIWRFVTVCDSLWLYAVSYDSIWYNVIWYEFMWCCMLLSDVI